MVDFKSLINKPTETKPNNPFAALNKTVAGVKAGASQPASATAGEVAEEKPASPAPFANLLGNSTASIANAPSKEETTGAGDDDLLSDPAPVFSEKDAAAEFQHEDQPEGYSKEAVENLKVSLDVLTNSLDNKELVSEALKSIMIDLEKHFFLKDILLPEDCNLMVRGLQASYGVTLAQKQKKQAKKESTAKDVDAVLDMMEDIQLEI